MENTQIKICSKCSIEKSIDEFNFHSKNLRKKYVRNARINIVEDIIKKILKKSIHELISIKK